MKRYFDLIIICACLIALTGCTAKQNGKLVFYVSKSGNDSWSGKLSESNSSKTDGPFATFERARDAIRALKKTGPLPDSGVTILIRGGLYTFEKSLTFTGEDSGTESSSMIWQAYQNELVHFMGGRSISGFGPIADNDVINRIDEAYREKIMASDLKAQGITDYDEIKPVGQSISSDYTSLELFFKDKRMILARYPNDGWLRITDVPQTGERMINKGLDRDTSPVPRGRHYGRFAYDDDRPEQWADPDDIWMFGYWVWDWAEELHKIDKIDLEKREIYPVEPHHSYGYQKGQRFYFLNILEELDSPGEWYLDRKTGILYFWPPEPIGEADIVISLLKNPIISFEDASYITVQGILFEATRGNAVEIHGGTHNKIAGCIIRNTGNAAVRINEGTYNGVLSCDIYDTGSGGIYLRAGDRQTLTPANNYAENNHIHHYSRLIKTYQSAVALSGVGNRMSHNLIHDAPHLSIDLQGNDHIIEYNEIHHVTLDTGDAGAINFDRNWTERGNVVRHNYFHHIQPKLRGIGAPQFQETMGIYLDAAACDLLIYGNVFYKSGIAIFINGGRDNIVENNIFVECEPSVFVSSLGTGWARRYIVKGGAWRMYKLLEEVPYKEPPWSTKYPELATILEDGDPAFARNNSIIRNISYGGKWMYLYDDLDLTTVAVKQNLVADSELVKFAGKNRTDTGTFMYGDRKIMDELELYGNIIMDTNPGFIDVEHGDFRLNEDSPAWELGFKPIPFDKIGLYMDEYRNSLPDTE